MLLLLLLGLTAIAQGAIVVSRPWCSTVQTSYATLLLLFLSSYFAAFAACLILYSSHCSARQPSFTLNPAARIVEQKQQELLQSQAMQYIVTLLACITYIIGKQRSACTKTGLGCLRWKLGKSFSTSCIYAPHLNNYLWQSKTVFYLYL